MAEQEAGEHHWYDGPLEAVGLAHSASEFHAVSEATEGFKTVRGGMLGMQAIEGAELDEGLGGAGVSNYLAPFALASGINNLVNGETPQQKIAGGLETVSGGVGTTGLAGAALTSAGAEGAGGLLTGAAASAAPLAAVAGAGAAGMAVGNAGNEFMSEKGWLGKNRDQKTNRNWSDLASDWGTEADEAAGGGALGTAAGLAATLGGSIVGTAGAALSSIGAAGEGIGHGIGKLIDWL